MSSPVRKEEVYLTPEEYLAAERVSDTKHEYLAGTIYAMAGADRAHNVIASTILRELGNQLLGSKCFPFGSDMRLRIRRHGSSFYYYPDVTVDCSGSKDDEIDQPTVIFEILSASTDRADRGDKLVNYQSLPSMRAYVLVNQYLCSVTAYRRGEDAEWTDEFLGSLDDTLHLPEIDCTLPLRTIYDHVL